MIPPCTKQGNLVAACESTVVCVLIEKLAALLGAASVVFAFGVRTEQFLDGTSEELQSLLLSSLLQGSCQTLTGSQCAAFASGENVALQLERAFVPRRYRTFSGGFS